MRTANPHSESRRHKPAQTQRHTSVAIVETVSQHETLFHKRSK
jgi:hypothetical protein